MNTLDDMIRHFESISQETISVMYDIVECHSAVTDASSTSGTKSLAAIAQALHATVRAFIAMNQKS